MVAKRVFKDTPINEITLRRFEKPTSDDALTLVRKLAISIGLLQPGDSRDIVSELLYLFVNSAKKKEFVTIEKVMDNFKDKDGGTPNNVRRQLRRLKELNIIERTSYGYRIKEFMPLTAIFKEYIMKYNIEPCIERIQEYCNLIDNVK
ncbi:Uncharacterised protein [Candidatus Tiddalikarchaeum anstoanum]|nr:Uncharacterised protein [Candidatus Tiddalikarchaeum anstoanum]